MYVRAESRSIHDPFRRATNETTAAVNNDSGVNLTSSPWGLAVIALVAAVVVLTATLFTYSHLRKQRLQHKVPKYIPGAYLKRKWMAWKPRGKYSSLDDTEESNSLHPQARQTNLPRSVIVDRHTSVRSIMSLPAYSQAPKESEEVIGREGERGGIDTVVEFPETAQEEEDRREEEMESLYHIRQTRRREIAERDERRRQRREAREAGDFARLEELRQQSRQRRENNNSNASNTNLTAEMLIQEHNARGRERRVSSVSYAAVGQVRHDGSRVRAESRESQRALLGQAAPMGDIPPLPSHSRQISEANSFLSLNDSTRPSARHRSDSGAVSVSSVGSSFENVSRSETRPVTAGTTATAHTTNQSISSSNSEEADIVDERVDPQPVQPGSTPLPPTYDAHDWGAAPAYEEQQRLARMNSTAVQNPEQPDGEALTQITSHPPQLPSLQVTPTISIQTPTQPNSPAVVRSAGGFSPISRDHPELR